MFSLIAVAKLDVSLCQSCDSVKLTEPSGYIASVVTLDTGCGAASCPWIIEGKPGNEWKFLTNHHVYCSLNDLPHTSNYTSFLCHIMSLGQ